MPVLLQGPYGSPSARLFSSHHAVLIGAGIGVTPFASILKSIIARHKQGQEMKLEKVHFFWLYRGQRTYDWFSEMLEEIDALRLKLLEINIYLTDTKVNATTGLLTVGLNLVHGATRRDVLTGLKSRTSFGRAGLGPGLLPDRGGAPISTNERLFLRPLSAWQGGEGRGSQGWIPFPDGAILRIAAPLCPRGPGP